MSKNKFNLDWLLLPMIGVAIVIGFENESVWLNER